MIMYDDVLSASCYKVRLMADLLNIPLTLKANGIFNKAAIRRTL